MRRLLAVLLLLGVAGSAGAVDWNTSNRAEPIDKDSYVGDNMGDTREGGENAASAVVIGSLPYNDSGATCDNIDDITLPCAASAAADVFYSYTPASSGSINVSLCGSGYDCALGIYDSALNNIACNDDFCGLQSQIDNINVTGGQTYYIVVDGFSTNCGSYVISVTENVPCVIDCPAGGQLEGEPPCGDNYFDSYNGGCNSTGWTTICPDASGSAVLCGKSGTYLYNGFSYRDTDWFSAYGNGGTMTATWRAEFPIQAIFIYGTNCNALQYDLGTGGPCQDVVLSRFVASGTEVWLWAGASQFNGIPCESDYTITVTGLGDTPGCAPSPTENTSWGAIKNLYK
jgi:hypothetical protein